MWHAEALNLASKGKNFLLFVSCLLETPFEWVKHFNVGPTKIAHKKFACHLNF
jgi:hypothetical protein